MKSKIIEMIGPPGVGKTTIYQSLCRTWKPRSQWVYPDVLLTQKPRFFSFRKWLDYQLRMKLGKKLNRAIPIDYGLRFAAQHQQLAQFCWNVLSDTQIYRDDEIDKRFRSSYFLFTTFCTYQAILEKAAAKPCIIPEGFLQRSFFIRDGEDDEQLVDNLLNRYLLLTPLPAAIFHIDTPDIDEIVKRLRGRNKTIASHIGKNDAALHRDIEKWKQVQHKIIEKLRSAGVLVLRIDAKQPVQENVSGILELLKKTNNIRAGSLPAANMAPNQTVNNF